MSGEAVSRAVHAVSDSPFHEGERRAQERVGARSIESWARRAVRVHLPLQHREFYSALPFVVAAARDDADRPWVTILEGEEGFITSPTEFDLAIDAAVTPGDALDGAIRPGSDLGILGIEFSTRRRNRINGRVLPGTDSRLRVAVDQTFGNCPQYIREREWTRVDPETAPRALRTDTLTSSQTDWIRASDTFFIASGYRGRGEDESFGMDASHRGGEAGFVEVVSESEIRFEDYPGNKHFNTIGNLLVDPRAGYLFVDWQSGSVLQLTGTASVEWKPSSPSALRDAGRVVTLHIEAVVEVRRALSLRWDAEASSVRSLRLIDKVAESADVTSFVFEARDGGALPSFTAGQHLPLEVRVQGAAERASRTYSLSGSPFAGEYRITVKREPHGQVSRYLHDALQQGAIVSARSPSGEFTMVHDALPVVLVSAGVGVTPMVSMLHALGAPNDTRRVLFAHGARDGAHHPLRGEVAELASRRPGIETLIAYSRPRQEDVLGHDFDLAGRLTPASIVARMPSVQAHVYLCGPLPFMTTLRDGLERAGVPTDLIHTETFGPTA